MTQSVEALADDRDGEPGIEAARERLAALGVDPSTWSNAPGDTYAEHAHATTKLLVCAEGSITFFVGPRRQRVELTAGRGIILAAGTPHAAEVGPAGCTCVEGHRRER